MDRDIAECGWNTVGSTGFRVCIKTAEIITLSCNLSYSRPNNFCSFNANSETSCIFVAIAKPLICAVHLILPCIVKEIVLFSHSSPVC